MYIWWINNDISSLAYKDNSKQCMKTGSQALPNRGSNCICCPCDCLRLRQDARAVRFLALAFAYRRKGRKYHLGGGTKNGAGSGSLRLVLAAGGGTNIGARRFLSCVTAGGGVNSGGFSSFSDLSGGGTNRGGISFFKSGAVGGKNPGGGSTCTCTTGFGGGAAVAMTG